MSFRRLVLALTIVPALAVAAPLDVTLTHSGYVLGAGDVPLNRNALFSFAIWDDAALTDPSHRLWPATPNACTLPVANGSYSVLLGAGCAAGLTTDHLPPTAPAWLEVSVDGVTLSPRVRLDPSAGALVAAQSLDAKKLGGALPATFHDASLLTGAVPAAALSNAVLSVNASAPLVASTTAGAVSMSLPRAQAGQDGYLQAADFTTFSGKLDAVARAASDSGLTGAGTAASPLQVAFGTTAGTVARGDDARFASLGSGGIQNGTTPQAASFNVTGTGQIGGGLTVGGNVTLGQNQLLGARVENSATLPVCNASREGYVVFDSALKQFMGCNGESFVPLSQPRAGGGTRLPVDIVNSAMTWAADSVTGGLPSYAGDKVNLTTATGWPSYCMQSSGTNGVHWLSVDLGAARRITSFGVAGYPGGSHRPVGAWELQASNDNTKRTAVALGGANDWTADGDGGYPANIVLPVTSPGSYRYYRVWSNNWTNGTMLICTLSLYELQAATAGSDAMSDGFAITSDSVTGGGAANVADKTNLTTATGWPTYCIQSSGTNGLHWLKVDFQDPTTITRFGVGGYPGGSHKPSSVWFLQGSNDDANWTTVWGGDTANWSADTLGTYPPRITFTATAPGAYRYYRIHADSWTNGTMLVCDWAMYR